MSKRDPGELFSGFDLLLETYVPHIWEKIFLSLDYDSFKNCLKVSKAWNDVFHTESFQAKLISKFLWMDINNTERMAWKSTKDIIVWTANSDEVAYVENAYSQQILHFINRDGEPKSRFLTLDRKAENIWILHHVILLKTKVNIFAVEKLGLKQSTISSLDAILDDCEEETTHFNPSTGIQFLSFIVVNELDEMGQWNLPNQNNDDNVKFLLREVPFDYHGEGHIYDDDGDERLPVYTYTTVCLPDTEENGTITFSEDGSRFLYGYDGGDNGFIALFSIAKDDSGLRIKHEWTESAIISG